MKKNKLIGFGSTLLLAIAFAGCGTGCGTTANMAGLKISADMAQNGVVAGITASGSGTGVTVGATYSQKGTNYDVSVTVPTGTNATAPATTNSVVH